MASRVDSSRWVRFVHLLNCIQAIRFFPSCASRQAGRFREAEGDAEAADRGKRCLDLAAAGLHRAADDGEAEAEAAATGLAAAGEVEPVEGLENPRELVSRNSRAVVSDGTR